MATDPRAQRALNRLGLIPKSGASTVADLRAFLLADLDNPSAGQIDKGELLGVGEAFRAARGFREQQKADREARAAERALTAKSAEQRSMSNSDPVLGEMKPGPTKRGPGVPQQIYLQ